MNTRTLLGIVLVGFTHAPSAWAASVSIPSIKVAAPVADVMLFNDAEAQKGMEHGMVRSTLDGCEILYGHSAPPRGYRGKFGRVLKGIGALKAGDTLRIDDRSYTLTHRRVVSPRMVGALDCGERNVVLFSCWPVGTTYFRLVWYGKPV